MTGVIVVRLEAPSKGRGRKKGKAKWLCMACAKAQVAKDARLLKGAKRYSFMAQPHNSCSCCGALFAEVQS